MVTATHGKVSHYYNAERLRISGPGVLVASLAGQTVVPGCRCGCYNPQMQNRILLLLPVLASVAFAQTKLLRYPDIQSDSVAFVYAGDLWKAPDQGGRAVRLTADPGLELFPKFSPDGRWIAFTGQYDGDEQVYVMPSDGGEPRQLTFYPARGPLAPRWGYEHQVYGWIPDSSAIVFRSSRSYWGAKDGRLYTVAIDGGLATPLEMPVSGAGVVSPDGDLVAYSPLFRDFRTWKRYQGGWAQDLYIFDRSARTALPITKHVRTDRDPMWIGSDVVFASDRDGTLNLYRYDTRSKNTRQLTREKKWDVRWPSSDSTGRIVYELNGELSVYDFNLGRSRAIKIEVPSDGGSRRPRRVSAAGNVESHSLSPKGRRAVFSARGDIFTVPAEKGPTRNLTRSSDAHDRLPSWSPDGRMIAFVSDKSGEEQVYAVKQDGGELEQLSEGVRGRLYDLRWSPDSKRIVFSDKEGKVYVLEVDSKQVKEIADEPRGRITDYAWSPRGGYLAFTVSVSARANSIFIWDAAGDKLHQVGGEMFDEHTPAWGANGDYLYYLSDREFSPLISSTEWNFATNRQTGVFALALRKDVPHPFPPESDEAEVANGDVSEDADGKGSDEGSGDKETDSSGDKDDGNGDSKKGPIRIDFDGLAERVARVPVDADNYPYSGLAAIDGSLLVVRGEPFYYGRDSGVESEIKIFDLKKRDFKTVTQGRRFALSDDGKKILVRQKGSYKLYDAKADAKSPKTLSTSGLQVDLVPEEEWETIFDEVWRRYRDFFYVENMHGYDWEAIGNQYRPWLAHVRHRSDLNYLIGEMIAELNVGHAYISGGDYRMPDRPKVALMGADLELDSASGRYRIARILRGHNEESGYRAPLTEIGVDARVGDYLLAIDGEEVSAGDNPYVFLRHKASRPVKLLLNDRPEREGAREVVYRPITDESGLRYLNWVEGNLKAVDEASDGRVGYIHVPDMSSSGISEFVKWYFPQLRKEGLVVDVRGNGGGNVSQMLIERLSRKLLGTRYSRTNSEFRTYPNEVFLGHLVCLVSENSASDGDIFAARFKQAGLGPLIGKRSWGGVIGITSHGALMDGGDVRVPEFATNAIDGSWIIEGHGVDPDIVVENDAESVLAGKDPQLERGIEEVLRRIRENPRPLPTRPADPVRTR